MRFVYTVCVKQQQHVMGVCVHRISIKIYDPTLIPGLTTISKHFESLHSQNQAVDVISHKSDCCNSENMNLREEEKHRHCDWRDW